MPIDAELDSEGIRLSAMQICGSCFHEIRNGECAKCSELNRMK